MVTIYYSKSKDQPGKVANPGRGQLNKENKHSLSPFVPENLVSRDGFGSSVPRDPVHFHTQAESGVYLWNSSRFLRQHLFIYVIHWRADNGGEHVGKAFKQYYLKTSITKMFAATNMPQQIVVSERIRQTLCNMVRCLLVDS